MKTAAVDAPIALVTVLEDRARVLRRGRVTLEPGDHLLTIAGVAPVLADRTLAARAGQGGRVVDVRVLRRVVVVHDQPDGATEEDAAALTRELRALERDLAGVEAERELAERHALGLAQLAVHVTTELAEDAGWGRTIDDGVRRLDGLDASAREARDQVLEHGRRREELERRAGDLRRRLQAVSHPGARARADASIQVAVERATELEIELEYVVPGACWRPYHRARLDGERLHFVTDACVWQNTGEDWGEVALVLSTERPSLGVEPPELHDDVLHLRRRAEELAVEARDQAVTTAGLGAARADRPDQVPGIDDAGEALELRPAGTARIPSDGRPYRVELGAFDSDAEVSLVAYPELDPAVLLRSRQVNRGDRPILAGPVDLIRDSGPAGRTSVLYVAPGERFDLGWGPEPDLRIHRDTRTSEEKSRVLSSWIRRTHTIEVRVSNLAPSPRRLEITERVPISEVEKVEIELDPKTTTAPAKPDPDGFLRWTLDLAPFGHDQLTLAYELRKHSDITGI
jgi:uncharacterized protein (TIGR02231 family)